MANSSRTLSNLPGTTHPIGYAFLEKFRPSVIPELSTERSNRLSTKKILVPTLSAWEQGKLSIVICQFSLVIGRSDGKLSYYRRWKPMTNDY